MFLGQWIAEPCQPGPAWMEGCTLLIAFDARCGELGPPLMQMSMYSQASFGKDFGIAHWPSCIRRCSLQEHASCLWA